MRMWSGVTCAWGWGGVVWWISGVGDVVPPFCLCAAAMVLGKGSPRGKGKGPVAKGKAPPALGGNRGDGAMGEGPEVCVQSSFTTWIVRSLSWLASLVVS